MARLIFGGLIVVVACLGIVFPFVGESAAEVGDVIQTINIPADHRGISVAKDCDGNLYYTNSRFSYWPSQNPLYEIEKKLYTIQIAGTVFLPPIDMINDLGDPIIVESLEWNESGEFLWTLGNNLYRAYCEREWPRGVFHRLNPTTGFAEPQFLSDG